MIEVNSNEIQRAIELLRHMPGAAQKATRTAMRKSINGAKVDAKNKVKERYTIKPKYITRTLKARVEGMRAILSSRGPVNDLAYFAHRPKSVPKRRPGVGKYTWVQVVKGQGGTIAHAFLARMKSGHVGIMRRTNGNASLPIEKLNAPSTPQMLGHPSIVKFMEERIQERFSNNMEHEVNAFLMGYRR